MRLKKLSLIAAAGLTMAAGLLADTNVTTNTTVSQLTDTYNVSTGVTLTLNTTVNSTFSKQIVGTGNFTKTGAGTLEWASYGAALNLGTNAYYRNSTFTYSGTNLSWPAALGSEHLGLNVVSQPLTRITNGVLTVNEGTLDVSGYINQWVDVRSLYNALSPVTADNQMTGFSSTVLSGSAQLTFANSYANVSATLPVLGAGASPALSSGSLRLNFVRNLTSRVDGNLTAVPNENNTRLNTGSDSSYRLISQTDTGNTGGVGFLDGQGRFIKTGAGTFYLLNDGTFSGDVIVGQGSLVLSSPSAGALAGASSVNLAGTGTSTGAVVSATSAQIGVGLFVGKPAYAPAINDGSAKLDIQTDQSINNLQALFYEHSTSVGAGYLDKITEIYILDTGTGSKINIAAGKTLTINQTADGYYTGSITGGTGNIVKNGAATLALMGSEASAYSNLTINAGKIIANVQSLGSGAVNLNGGTLSIVQNNAGTLSALITGASGTLLFTTADTVNNGNAITVGNGQIGTVDIVTAQTFAGTVQVNNGIIMVFHAGNGDTFANASEFQLLGGVDNLQTRLAFSDTNQTFRNFYGDDGTRIDLGRGTITLVQNKNLSYAGQITGTGNFVKDGSAAFTLTGRDINGNSTDTYYGATVVKSGSLVLTGTNQLPNTSGLVLSGGAVSLGGTQRFGALFGNAGSSLGISGTLTIGLTPGELDALRNALASTPGSVSSPGSNGYYFDTGAAQGVNGASVANTQQFLAAYGVNANEANAMAFAGVISGGGSLVKIGAERLKLTGVNTYTGATSVQGGTLEINANSIANTSSITVASGAGLAVNVDTGSSATFSQAISGGGSFEKTGGGDLTLADNATTFTGGTAVSAGTLRLTLKASMTGAITIAPGATLVATQNDSLTYTAPVSGTGTFDKEGSGTLTLTNFTGFTGNVVVGGGKLSVNAISPSPASIAIASGATFEALLSGSTTYTGTVSGAGTFALTGADVTFASSSDAFTGTLAMTNGTITAGVNDIFKNASYSLVNSTLNLNGTNQQVTAFAGDAVSVLQLGGGTLTFAPGAGVVREFAGAILGNGAIVKNGAGTQRLSTSDGGTPWSGTTTVNAGTLEASSAALGNSTATVNAGGTLAFYNNIPDSADVYANAIAGAGTLGKTGVGALTLTNTSAGFSGNIAVTQGELRIDTATGMVGTPAKAFPSVSVATGGVYAVVMKAGNTVGGVLLHDSSDMTNRVTDAAPVDGVAQHGSLAVEGAFTLRFANGQSYTGNTILREARNFAGQPIAGTGATLDIAGSTGLNGVLNGLAGEFGTTVVTNGAALTIVQSVAGQFDGAFNALTDITVQGSAKFGFGANATNVGNLTVDGGNLVMDAAATNNVALTNGGTLYFDTTNSNQVYAGSVSGTGNMIKTGVGTLDLNGDLSRFTVTGAIGVDQGRMVVSIASLESAPNITGLIARGTGELALDVSSGDERKMGVGGLDIAVSGDGSVVKSGDGKLLLGDAANPYTLTSTGELVVEQGTLGGYFTTSGALRVASGGTLAPGNSPGTVTVNGNFTSNGTLALELASGGVSDKIVVNGTATLGAGTQFYFAQYGTGSLQNSSGYRVIEATGGIQAAEGDFTLAPGSRRVIIVTPARNVNATLLNGVLLGRGDANAVVVYDMPSLASTAGFSPHDGLGGMLGQLDNFTVNQYALPDNVIGAALAFAAPSTLSKTINNLSPLGFSSFYAMTRDTAAQQEDRIRERLEQRRYDAAGFANEEWEAFVVGTGATADNKSSADTPLFDYKTYGGQVGFDKRIEGGAIVGGAAGYDNGTATLHDSGGKMEMNHARATAFMSSFIARKWFLEGGLSAGFGDYTSKRDTFVGRNTGSTTAYDVGFNVNTGTILVVTEDLHLTPHAGFSYMHQEFDGVNESGTPAALKVDGWSQDSLRFSIGTGLGWWLNSAGDLRWKLGIDVAYNHEFLDTDSKLNARFSQLGGGPFSVTAAALPADSLSFGPNVGLFFNDTTSVSAGLNYEYGFDGRNYTSVNVAFRKRF